MTRFRAALWRMRRVSWPLLGLGLLVLLAMPSARVWTWGFVLGLLVGLMNVNLLASSVRRSVRLPSRVGAAALTVSGVIRFGLVLALLAWILLMGPPVAVAPLLVGLFLPEMVVLAGVVWGREPFDLEGDTR